MTTNKYENYKKTKSLIVTRGYVDMNASIHEHVLNGTILEEWRRGNYDFYGEEPEGEIYVDPTMNGLDIAQAYPIMMKGLGVQSKLIMKQKETLTKKANERSVSLGDIMSSEAEKPSDNPVTTKQEPKK